MERKSIYVLFALPLFFIIVSCPLDSDKTTWKASDYEMIEVPVPQGGITFPIGYNDDNTATVDKAFYLGETQVTFGLWQAVAYWATFDKEGEKYDQICYQTHPYLANDQQEYPISGVTYLQVLVWCNAYTEWYNENYKTNYTPVYVDQTGEPLRGAKVPLPPTQVSIADLKAYIAYYPAINEYLNNVTTAGTGFRLPTDIEWELAARWRGADTTNTVTATVDDVDFSQQPIKFTKGNSVSGASDAGYPESHKYAVFEYNSKGSNIPLPPKNRLPNALNIYDMCGNLREFTYYVEYVNLRAYDNYPYPFALTKGGGFEDVRSDITIGVNVGVDVAAYNYYYGVRIARDKE